MDPTSPGARSRQSEPAGTPPGHAQPRGDRVLPPRASARDIRCRGRGEERRRRSRRSRTRRAGRSIRSSRSFAGSALRNRRPNRSAASPYRRPAPRRPRPAARVPGAAMPRRGLRGRKRREACAAACGRGVKLPRPVAEEGQRLRACRLEHVCQSVHEWAQGALGRVVARKRIRKPVGAPGKRQFRRPLLGSRDCRRERRGSAAGSGGIVHDPLLSSLDVDPSSGSNVTVRRVSLSHFASRCSPSIDAGQPC